MVHVWFSRVARFRFTLMVVAWIATVCPARPASAKPARAAAAVEIPLVRVGDHAVVAARVNGAGPYRFMVDSGADHSVLSPAVVAAAKGVVRGRDIGVVGIGPKPGKLTLLHGVTLRFGDTLDLPMQWATEALAVMLDGASSAMGTRIDGVLGYDVFRRYVVDLDYPAATLRLHEPDGYRYGGPGEVIPLVRSKGLAYVFVRLTPREGDEPLDCVLMLDTGSDLDVSLRRRAVEPHALDQRVPTTVGGAMGAGGKSISRVGRVARLALRGTELKGVWASFSRSDEGLPIDGTLGCGVLRQFRTVIDYPGERLVLERGPDFGVARPWDQSGLGLLAEGADWRQYRVGRVTEGGPAAEAGVRAGDLVLAVDGKRTADMTLQQLRAALRETGPRTLELRREEETVKCRIVLRPLL